MPGMKYQMLSPEQQTPTFRDLLLFTMETEGIIISSQESDNMELKNILQLQGTLFAMMLIGAWLKKRGIISPEGKK